MPLKVSRRGQIPPFIVMDVMRAAEARAASGADVIHCEVGQPGDGPPARVREAAAEAVRTHPLGYTTALGLESLRRRIARHYAETYGHAVPWERIVVTQGSSGAFLLAFLAAFDPGDRVALVRPGYPAYRHILTALGLTVVDVPVGPETGYQPTPALLAAAGPLDGVVVASPNNPTGSMFAPVDLEALTAWCEGAGVRLVSDEIYHGLCYGKVAATAAAFGDHPLVVNSFSKYFGMTGWRLGWMVVPEDMLRAVECLAQNLFISPAALAQVVGPVALDAVPEMNERVARYARSRDRLLTDLPRRLFPAFAPPDGAFYLYAALAPDLPDSRDLCTRLLAETGVALTPGWDFDPVDGGRFVRFSFAGAPETMAEAARRLQDWAETLPGGP